MSTRATIYYTDELHIYIELIDDTIHLEYQKGAVEVDIEIMSFEKWVALGFPDRNVDKDNK